MCNVLLVYKGKTLNVECLEGIGVIDALLENQIFMNQPCSGHGICGKCKIEGSGSLSPPSDDEIKHLGLQLSQGYRLGCMTKIIGDCIIKIPDEEDIKVASEFNKQIEMNTAFIGISIDIGTTTISGHIITPEQKNFSYGIRNPQSILGADVISRITASLEGKGKLLKSTIVDALNDVITYLSNAAGVKICNVNHLVITGNTAMMYFLKGISPKSISVAPFEADNLFGEEISSWELGLITPADTKIYLPRCVSAFVGADITCSVLASGMTTKDATSLLIDIGTNGEIALWHKNKLYCASTAAGPTFEGAGIKMGMQGTNGAIEKVKIDKNGNITIETIGKVTPTGICGSGVIDIVAIGLSNGIIDETGAIENGNKNAVPLNGRLAIKLCENIYFTQEDVRMVQLAKSAICAGIKTIIDCAGINANEIERFYIAGGFGSFINLTNASDIGLFPKELLSKAIIMGNAAQIGADMLLLDLNSKEQASRFLSKATTIDLSSSKEFTQHFYEEISF